MKIAFQYYPLEQCPEYIIILPDDADIDYEILIHIGSLV